MRLPPGQKSRQTHARASFIPARISLCHSFCVTLLKSLANIGYIVPNTPDRTGPKLSCFRPVPDSLRCAFMDSDTLTLSDLAGTFAERPGLPRYSVFQESRHEIDSFKWIESERVGYDLGETAIRQWVLDHWRGYLRARWLEHLQGKKYWIELDRGDFGLLSRAFCSERQLLDTILEQLKAGQENLDVLYWANQQQVCTEPVVRILEALDINSRRLLYKFEHPGLN
jgi:hypothetical protein